MPRELWERSFPWGNADGIEARVERCCLCLTPDAISVDGEMKGMQDQYMRTQAGRTPPIVNADLHVINTRGLCGEKYGYSTPESRSFTLC